MQLLRVGRNGFTLIELMVSLAVLAILVTMAVPSFLEFRQRSALRGAADQIVSFWGSARFEALRRNQPVKVALNVNSAGNFCLGATTASAAQDTACDCFTANACTVGAFPSAGAQADWRGVVVASPVNTALTLPTLGNTDTDYIGVAAIDPKRGGLVEAADAGFIRLQGPPGNRNYQLNVVIDRNGRAFVCEPATAPAKIPAFADLQCQ